MSTINIVLPDRRYFTTVMLLTLVREPCLFTDLCIVYNGHTEGNSNRFIIMYFFLAMFEILSMSNLC